MDHDSFDFARAFPVLAKRPGMQAELEWLSANRFQGGDDVRFCRLLCKVVASGEKACAPVRFLVQLVPPTGQLSVTASPWVALAERVRRDSGRVVDAWVASSKANPEAPVDLTRIKQLIGLIHWMGEKCPCLGYLHTVFPTPWNEHYTTLRAIALKTELGHEPMYARIAREALGVRGVHVNWELLRLVAEGKSLRKDGAFRSALDLLEQAVAKHNWVPDAHTADFLARKSHFSGSAGMEVVPVAQGISVGAGPGATATIDTIAHFRKGISPIDP